MEVETVSLNYLDRTLAFCSNTDQDFGSPPYAGHFPPDVAVPAEALDFTDRSRCITDQALPTEANPNPASSPSEHPMGLSLPKCGFAPIEANDGVEGGEETEHPSTEELMISVDGGVDDRQEGVDVEPASGVLSVVGGGSEDKATDSAIVAVDFSDRSRCTDQAPLTEANPNATSSPSEHPVDLSLPKCGFAPIESNDDVQGRAEVEHPSKEELMISSVDRQEGVGGLSVVAGSEDKAAIRLQKVYKGYRTRRRLADSAIVAEELWWQARDYARLNHSTVSFFSYSKPETVVSRWNRVAINASKVGQGLSKDGKALKLAFQHWIEAIDPRHRYGHNLHFYYEKWCESETNQPFFYWLDLGEGRNLELEECSRSLLRQQCIKYLGPHERECYEYVLDEGRIKQKLTGDLLDTTKGPERAKWIFVMSTSKRLYAGRKEKGRFQHSSFLAGGSTIAAGRFTAENGVLKAIWAYSGHYKPTAENLQQFLDYLRDNGADLNLVQIRSSDNEDYSTDDSEIPQPQAGKLLEGPKPPPLRIPQSRPVYLGPLTSKPLQSSANTEGEVKAGAYRRTFSGGLQSPVGVVPEKAMLERIKSKRESGSYQLGQQVSSKWCSGVGPRIGCVADYPLELRLQALEFTNLSPRRISTTPTHSFCSSSVLSPLSAGNS